MGASLVTSLCCILCRLLPRELLQGFWCRHDRRDVSVGLRLSSLRSWGLLRVLLLRCIACLRGSACWHVASLSHPTVPATLAPCPRVSACLWMECSLSPHAGPICTWKNSSLCVAFLVSVSVCLVPDLAVSPIVLHGVFTAFSMFHGSLSGCERNTRVHVNASLFSVLRTCSIDSNRYSWLLHSSAEVSTFPECG